ncbi:MAG TPA: SDR family oxidoreductase [Ignavibacteria bacterium]|nr:SDR family oxidoreductase [Ignavibacteria bacterium]
MNLSESIIILTGSSGNLGNSMFTYFQDKVKFIYQLDINENKSNQSNNSEFIKCDLTDYDNISKIVDEVYSKENKPSVLINNAGYIHNELIVNLTSKESPVHSLENWKKTIDINLNSVFNISSNVIFNMVKNRIKGVIINISSIASSGIAGQSAYSASKAALNALSSVWSKELGMFGIRCNSVSPGFIDTESTRTSLSESKLNSYKKNTSLGKLGNPENICEGIKFIIENNYYTGSVLNIDGGLKL